MAVSDDIGRRNFREPAPEREVDVLRRALNILQACLPETWAYQVDLDARRGDVAFDTLVTLEAPDGCTVTLAVEAKRLIATRDISEQLDQLGTRMARADMADAVAMLVARYLAPSVRQRLERAGAAYADVTGNLGARDLARRRRSRLVRVRHRLLQGRR